MTPDLQRLRSAKALEPILENMEFEFFDDPESDEPSDTSYLSAKEKADPDIASNVEAMAATNKLISWFGKDMSGFVGLWRGPKSHALDKAPIVILDTEGQYEIAALTIADWIAVKANEDDFADTSEALVQSGFKPAASQKAIWKSLDELDGDAPNDYRNELYNAGRVRRGLKPVD